MDGKQSTHLRPDLRRGAPAFAFELMISVRIRGQTYRVSKGTLDRAFGESWRHSSFGVLQNRILDRLGAGKLVARGQRLQIATATEEAEQRLRSATSQDEILRWGLLHVASQIAEATTELRALHAAFDFDESAATAKLSRDTARNRDQERA